MFGEYADGEELMIQALYPCSLHLFAKITLYNAYSYEDNPISKSKQAQNYETELKAFGCCTRLPLFVVY